MLASATGLDRSRAWLITHRCKKAWRMKWLKGWMMLTLAILGIASLGSATLECDHAISNFSLEKPITSRSDRRPTMRGILDRL